jgi:3-isopropylmalate/(R)-2-methylmalate dehydratase small subunit
MDDAKRNAITARGIPLRGNDIDTDRILPARYLKSVVFDGLGEHAFEDDRAQLRATGEVHPFDDPRFAEGQVLLVNQNFGCGSSREHAPQALLRWRTGVRAVVGESFAEIFYGNCVAVGVPCVGVDSATIVALQNAVEAMPTLVLRVDLEARAIVAGTVRYACSIADGPRAQFLDGTWDSTAELLAGKDRIVEAAARIPYFRNYA